MAPTLAAQRRGARGHHRSGAADGRGQRGDRGPVAAQISNCPPPCRGRWRRLSSAIGHWLSRPFASSPLPLAAATLSTWLGYGMWVMLAAKLLGGRGTLHGFFGATAFFAVPHVLDIFAACPCRPDPGRRRVPLGAGDLCRRDRRQPPAVGRPRVGRRLRAIHSVADARGAVLLALSSLGLLAGDRGCMR